MDEPQKDPDQPRGAVLEIIERRKVPIDGMGGDIIVPTEIRMNGQKLLMPKGHPIKVHEMELPGNDAVMVTLTVFARRITVAAEDDPAPVGMVTDPLF